MQWFGTDVPDHTIMSVNRTLSFLFLLSKKSIDRSKREWNVPPSSLELPNGLRFNVAIDGMEGAPWVMMSNSLATNLSLWDELAASLSDRFRLFRYDQRGHGGSDAPSPPYAMDELVADAEGLMDVAGIQTAHFIGISMGGIAGWALARRCPERLASLTICDAAMANGPAKDWIDRIEILERQGVEALVEPTLGRWFTKDSLAKNTKAVQRVRDMIATTKPKGFAGCMNALMAFDYSKDVERLRLPVLLVSGAHDGQRPQTMAADAARIPGARLAVIPDAGHLPCIENPEPFNKAVGAFLDSVAGA